MLHLTYAIKKQRKFCINCLFSAFLIFPFSIPNETVCNHQKCGLHFVMWHHHAQLHTKACCFSGGCDWFHILVAMFCSTAKLAYNWCSDWGITPFQNNFVTSSLHHRGQYMPILHVSGVSSQTHCYAVMVILLIRIQETLLSDQSLLDVHAL